MSNFSYKDAKGNLTEVPVRYGDMSRQVGAILKKNSENIIQSAPFIACYIKDMQFDRSRLADPTFVSKVNIRERNTWVNPDTQQVEYINEQGENYTVERLMPTPYIATFQADIWTTNTEQKLQLWEQIVVLFNPSLEIQTTNNFIDWTSLSVVELTSQQFESRSIPQGLESDISICTLTFTAPIWITPPAKVRQLGIITKIIANIYDDQPGNVGSGAYKDVGLYDTFAGRVASSRTVVTPSNYNLLILNNIGTLIPKRSDNSDNAVSNADVTNKGNWRSLLDLYPGEFKAGLSQLRVTKNDGNELVAYISLNPTDDNSMHLDIDSDTIPTNTIIQSRGTIDAIINPIKFDPISASNNSRYLILDDINTASIDPETIRPTAWKKYGLESLDQTRFIAHANDIISWTGTQWVIIFNSLTSTEDTYITNSYTGIQYKWDGEQWSKSVEGVYEPGDWRLIL
jgi:hypothetical protein